MATSNRKQESSLSAEFQVLIMQLFLELVVFVTQDISSVVLCYRVASHLWMSYFHNIIKFPDGRDHNYPTVCFCQ